MLFYAVKYGESTYSNDHIFMGGDPKIIHKIDFKIFLIITDKKRVLIDAGCDTMPGWKMKHFESPAVILERHGFPTDSITDVIITHSHHDHIEAVKHFKNAKVYIQQEEYESGKKYIPENTEVVTFENEYELCNGIKVLKIGGHSVGSCIVTFPRNGKTVVITGDEVYHDRSITEKIPVGYPFSPEKSRRFVLEYSKDNYEVHVCHSATFLPDSNGIFEL